MKLLLMFALLTAPLFAQDYQRTEGPLTIYAFDWSASIAVLTGAPTNTPNAFGLWLTVCTTDTKSAVPLKAIMELRADTPSAATSTRVVQFSAMFPNSPCVSAFALNIKRANVTALSIVTSAVDLGAMGN